MATPPFNVNALLTVEGALQYLPEHAIEKFPLEHQNPQFAGQIVVVREMAKLRRSELQERRRLALPELALQIEGNHNVKPISDFTFWRNVLGWQGSQVAAGSKQAQRYCTSLSIRRNLLKNVNEKYIWDHKVGQWKTSTFSEVGESTERREWVCQELERIDALRYSAMEDWVKDTQTGFESTPSKKRKRASDTPVPVSNGTYDDTHIDQEDAPTNAAKLPKLTTFTSSFTSTLEGIANLAQPSIEPPVVFPPPQPRSSQETSSFSSSLSSPDSHAARSPAPEPESPEKSTSHAPQETHRERVARYTFVLDIPTHENLRVQWLLFLDQYNWNEALISSLRKFFCLDPAPNMRQMKAFLVTLKEVCKTIEVVDGSDVESYRLAWDKKVDVSVEVVSSMSPPQPPTTVERQTGADLVLSDDAEALPLKKRGSSSKKPHRSSSEMPSSPPPSKSKQAPARRRGGSNVKDQSSSMSTSSPSRTQRNKEKATKTITKSKEADSDDRINAADLISEHIKTLQKGDRMEPRCDRCRSSNITCKINKTSCQNCAGQHMKCAWNNVTDAELAVLLANQGGAGGAATLRRPEVTKKSTTQAQGGKSVGTKAAEKGAGKGSKDVFDFPGDDDEDSDGASSSDDAEEDWVPTS